MNNKELIEKIEEMDSNKDIMLEDLIEETDEYYSNLKNNKIEHQLQPSVPIEINNENYAIFYIGNKEEKIDCKKNKYMEIFKIYKNNGYTIDFMSNFVVYAGRDVYKWKNYSGVLYCQLEEVERIENIYNGWRYKDEK